MEEIEFWHLIESARESRSHPQLAQRLKNVLVALPPNRVIEFDAWFDKLRQAADIGDVWAAALLMNGGSCSDDGFHYFRNWLIGQGREVYETSLRSPDLLATLPATLDSDGRPKAQDESLGYSAAEAYETIANQSLPSVLSSVDTPRDSTKPLDLSFFVSDWDWRDYSDSVIEARLPMLWRKYGEYKLAFDRATEERAAKNIEIVDVPGIGTLRVGDTVIHKTYGPGVIVKIVSNVTRSAILKFGDMEKGFQLSADFFEPIQKPL